MTTRGLARRAVTGAVALAITGAAAHAQEPLTLAKTYYAAAAYEEALLALAAARPGGAAPDAAEVAAYRAFCLLALGRTEEARAVVQSLVLIDPLFHPAEDQASPRVRAFFDEVRGPMLGDLARQAYASAQDAFAREDMATAGSGFGRVVKLIDEIAEPVDTSLVDLRMLAAGFKELLDRTATTPEVEQPKARQTTAAATETPAGDAGTRTGSPAVPSPPATPVWPDPDRVYAEDDPDIVKPAVISRQMPPWVPPAGSRREVFSGIVEVIIDRNGHVESSMMRDSIHPLYDSLVLSTSRTWRFKPATKDGHPVRYRYRIAVRIEES